MSRFTIIPFDEIEGKYLNRAKELVEFWLARPDAEKEDLVAMIAEGFQAQYNILYNIVVEDSLGGQGKRGNRNDLGEGIIHMKEQE